MEDVAYLQSVDRNPPPRHIAGIRPLLHATTTAIALSIAGLLSAEEPPPSFETTLRQWLLAIESPTYAPRAEASDVFRKHLWNAYDRDPQQTARLLQTYTAPSTPSQGLTAGQRASLHAAENTLNEWKYCLPHALGQHGIVQGDVALDLMRTTLQLPMIASDSAIHTLKTTPIDLRGERSERLVNGVLGRLCNVTNTKPMPHINGEYSLTPLAENERITWSNELIGVTTLDPNGTPEKLTLQMEPGRGAILSFIDRKGKFATGSLPQEYLLDAQKNKESEQYASHIPLRIQTDDRPDWHTHFLYLGNVHQSMDAFHPTHTYAVVADAPQTIDLRIDGGSHCIGMQTLCVPLVQQLPNGEWQVECFSRIFAYLPWEKTVPAWDRLTYILAHTNRYQIRDNEGLPMRTTITKTHFEQRMMTMQIVCPKKPASFTVQAFTRMHPQWLELPPLPPTSPMQPANR